MLKKNLFNVSTFYMILAILFALNMNVTKSSKGQDPGNVILSAYDLRMNGHADSAGKILNDLLSQDSNNATVWFELARATHHEYLGDMRSLMENLDKLQSIANQAVKLEPENQIFWFYKCKLDFLNTYIIVMQDKSGKEESVQQTIESYRSLLKIAPDYHEATLYLIEIMLFDSELFNKDQSEVEKIVKKLEKADAIYGAKARELILPDSIDRVLFWQKILESNPNNADVNEMLGKAYIYQDNDEMAKKYLERAYKLDPDKSNGLLDIARYYIMNSRTKDGVNEEVLNKAKDAMDSYLETEPIGPYKAFALNWLGRVYQFLDMEEKAEECYKLSKEIDPYVPRTTGAPGMILFVKPGEVSHHHGYFSRPY